VLSRIQVLGQICSSEAAASISSKELQSLLNTALSKQLYSSARALLHCPATADITATMLGQLLQCALNRPDVNAPRRGPAADGSGQRSNSYAVLNAADLGVSYLASCLAGASISDGQQQHIGQPPMLLADGAVAVGARAAAQSAQADMYSASTDPAVTAGQPGHTECEGFASEQLVQQLHAAVQQRDGTLAAALCSCAAAGQLSHAVVRELLLAAVAAPPPLPLPPQQSSLQTASAKAGKPSKPGKPAKQGKGCSARLAAGSAFASGGSHQQLAAIVNPVQPSRKRER
jgi:hypothetical protein